MNFVNTIHLLERQAKQHEIPLEAVTNLLRTYLTEVRQQTGVSVEKCRIGSTEQLVASLAAVTSEINRVFQKNEHAILGEEDDYTEYLHEAQEKSREYEGKIKALEENIRLLKDERSRHEQSLKMLEAQNADIAGLQKEVEDLHRKIGALAVEDPDSVAGRLQIQLTRQRQEHAQLEEEYNQALQESRELEETVNKQNAKLTSINQEVKQKGEQSEQLEKALQPLREKAAALDQEIARKQAAKDALDGEHTARTERLEILRSDHAVLEKAVAELKEKIAPLETACTELTAEKAGLEQKQQNAASEKTKLEQELQNLEEHIGKLRTAAEMKAAEIQTAEQTLQEEQQRDQELVQQYTELTTQIEMQRTDNDSFRTGQVDPTRTELTQLLDTHKAEEAALEGLKQELAECEAKRRTLADETTIQKLKINTTRHKLDETQQELEAQQKTVAALEKELEEKASECKGLLDREKELRDLLDENDMARVKREISENIQKLEDTIKQAKADETEAERIRGELEEKEKTLDAVRGELARCTAARNALWQEYSSVKQQLDAVTAPEKQQRCESLHNELELMILISQRLHRSSRQVCGEGFCVADALQEELLVAESTVNGMRSAIREYIELRQKSLTETE